MDTDEWGGSLETESPYEFDLFAHYYELEHADYDEDIPFYLDLAQRSDGPLFELGCGTGRLLLPLAEAGYRLTGIDVAGRMLEIARQRLKAAGVLPQVTLVQADMCAVQLTERFRAGFCGLNTLMHVPTLAGQFAVLRSAFRHLRSGGLFAVDLPNPHRSMLTEERTPLSLERELVDPATGHHILKLFSQRGDLATQVADVTLLYDEIDRLGQVRRTLVPMQMRWLYPYELRLLMEAAGFTVEQVYGSYDLEPFEASSERMIVLGRAP